jgi:hypothetical protein
VLAADSSDRVEVEDTAREGVHPGETDGTGAARERCLDFVGRQDLAVGLEHAHLYTTLLQSQPGQDVGRKVVRRDDDLVAAPQIEPVRDKVQTVRRAVGENDVVLVRAEDTAEQLPQPLWHLAESFRGRERRWTSANVACSQRDETLACPHSSNANWGSVCSSSSSIWPTPSICSRSASATRSGASSIWRRRRLQGTSHSYISGARWTPCSACSTPARRWEVDRVCLASTIGVYAGAGAQPGPVNEDLPVPLLAGAALSDPDDQAPVSSSRSLASRWVR